ncbi:MAG TPA: DUF2127 domain-containing protein [Verrucomicrobiae bacterium]|nr:DUF2127 domain-containing protein [Verrucomicrobiae bacterium]
MSTDTHIIKPKTRRAPTLYFIIMCKLVKGTLALGLALFILKLAGQDLSDAFDRLLHWFHLDPEGHFFSEVGAKLDTVTPANVRWVGIVTVLYSLISLVEAVGLMFRAPWAGWLAIGESAFFIPIEVRELVVRPHGFVLAVLALNVLIVWYLFANRSWLFRHHH